MRAIPISKPTKEEEEEKLDRGQLMEFQFPSWPFLFSLFLPMLLFVLIKKKKNTIRLPPGPTKLPIIGNLHNLILGSDSVPRFFRDLAKKHGPLMHLQVGQVPLIVVSSSDVAEQFLKTHEINFATRPSLFMPNATSYNRTDVGFAPYGEYWRKMKKICILELFSAKRVKSFGQIRHDEVGNVVNILTKAATTGTPVNMSQLFLRLYNNITCRSTFGDKCRHQDAFLAALQEIVDTSSGFGIVDLFPDWEPITTRLTGLKYRVEKVMKSSDRILDRIIDEHLQKTTEGLENNNMLAIILRLRNQNDFDFEYSMSNVKSVIMNMFIAGTETTATTSEWALSELVKNQDVMKKATSEARKVPADVINEVNNTVYKEMSYMQNILKENFRLHPPAPFLLPRECREKCQINGYDIEEKTRMIVNAWALGRDPKKWEEPDLFKPERFIGNPIDFKGTYFDLIPFGAGRRICPAVSFAHANVELLLAKILYHFDWKLPNDVPGNELDMTENFGGTVSRKHPLILVPLFPTTT